MTKPAKTAVVIYGCLLLIFFNAQIFLKERIKAEGEIIYYKLAPVDPRAFMLGDYMALRYTPTNSTDSGITLVVVTLDDNQTVSDFSLYNADNPLMDNQRLLNVRKSVRPERFYFQEGHADAYSKAEYGIFRYCSPDEYLLEGLADSELKKIDPTKP